MPFFISPTHFKYHFQTLSLFLEQTAMPQYMLYVLSWKTFLWLNSTYPIEFSSNIISQKYILDLLERNSLFFVFYSKVAKIRDSGLRLCEFESQHQHLLTWYINHLTSLCPIFSNSKVRIIIATTWKAVERFIWANTFKSLRRVPGA